MLGMFKLVLWLNIDQVLLLSTKSTSSLFKTDLTCCIL